MKCSDSRYKNVLLKPFSAKNTSIYIACIITLSMSLTTLVWFSVRICFCFPQPKKLSLSLLCLITIGIAKIHILRIAKLYRVLSSYTDYPTSIFFSYFLNIVTLMMHNKCSHLYNYENSPAMPKSQYTRKL